MSGIANNPVIAQKRQIANRLKNYPKDYTYEQKCFGSDDIPPEAKKAKDYIKSLVDPDILGNQDYKRWNVCSKLQEKATEKKDLDQILFNVKYGLTDVNTVKLKDQKIYDGVEVKYEHYFNWNVSSKLEPKEKNNIFNNV